MRHLCLLATLFGIGIATTAADEIQLPKGWKWDQSVAGKAARQGDAIRLDTVNGRIWAGEGNRNRIITESPIGDRATALANIELVDAAGKWEQCGLLAYHNDDSFVKLVLEHIDGKHHAIMAWEIDGKRKVLALLEIPTSRADLRMQVDGDTVRGFWRSDSSQTWNPVAETEFAADQQRYFMVFAQDGDPARPRHALVRNLSWRKGE